MFNGIESTVSDLLLFDRRNGDIPLRVALPQPAVARAILQIAGGKIPEHLGHPIVDALHADEIAAARHFVAGQFLAPGADHFRVLGLPHDADASAIRDHFRRLMGLVHPDSNPVGYPDDAAIRVNRAYAVLSGDESRAQYLASLGSDSFAMVIAPPRARADGHVLARQRSAAPKASIWQRWSDKLRARHNLLLLATILVLPAIWFATSGLRTEDPVRLVEAKRRVVTGTVGAGNSESAPAPPISPVSSSAATGAAALTSSGASTIVAAANSSRSLDRIQPEPTKPVAESTTLPPVAAPIATAERGRATLPASNCRSGCANALSPELSPRSMNLVAAKSPPSLAPSVPSPNGSISFAASAGAAAGTPASPAATGQATPAAAVASSREIGRTAPASATQPAAGAAAQPQTGNGPEARTAESLSLVRPSDVEDLLARFSSAYESGSMPAFSQLFSATMIGRRQLLNDYERVFVSTRSRAIKFGQLKQSAIGERLALAGYATVTTIDSDNRTSTQRIFLEFEIGRDRGESRIERLANYAMN